MPLVFQPGEAFQFDWSEDWATIGGEQRLRSHMTPDAAADDSPEAALEIATKAPMENPAVTDWRNRAGH